MARRKETLWQQDFSLGAVRPEAEERDDVALIETSLREAENTVTLSTGQTDIRPGMVYLNDTAARKGVECDLGSGRVYDLHITPTGLILYDADDAVEYTNAAHDWTALTGKFGTYTFSDIRFWVLSDPDTSAILIGSHKFPTQALVVDSAGSWSLGAMALATSLAGAIGQSYWRHYEGVTIQPSARTGAITITASDTIWVAAHSGMAIRYGDREIILGAPVSTSIINATVTEELPPSYDITVASVSNYQIGEAVEHSILGGQGIITGISGSIITVLATSSYDGFNATSSPKLVGPNAAQVISLVSSVSPVDTFLWDVQLQNPIHGYAGWAARHKGRVFLCDFPSSPQAYASSVAGDVTDFTMGPNDGDGFAESIGTDSGGSLKYIVSAEDLVFLTTRGLYYQPTRNGEAITPETIGPIAFSRMGCAQVDPVVVDDGCIFVDAVGKQVYAAVLAGDIYKSWRAQLLTKFHPHLLNMPDYLGATSSGSQTPEQFIYAINTDGTAAVCQWDRDENTVSWRPWATDGAFVAIYQCFGSIHAVVDRTIATVDRTMRERFETGIFTDCTASVKISSGFPEGEAGVSYDWGVTAFATHLDGHVGSVYMEGWDLGDNTINASGKPVDADANVIDYPDYEGVAQVGLAFEMTIAPWSRRSVRSQRGVREIKRLIELFVSVQTTGVYTIDGQSFGGYRAGEDLSIPPPVRTQQSKITFLGKKDHERIAILKSRPGPFRLMKLGYRVTI